MHVQVLECDSRVTHEGCQVAREQHSNCPTLASVCVHTVFQGVCEPEVT